MCTHNNLIITIILVSSGRFNLWSRNFHVPILGLHLIFFLLLLHQSRSGRNNLREYKIYELRLEFKILPVRELPF